MTTVAMDVAIEETEKMTEKTHAVAITMATAEADEAARDQNYHMILTNTTKGIINEDITLRIVYY